MHACFMLLVLRRNGCGRGGNAFGFSWALRFEKRKSRPKRFWIRKLLSRRPQQGEYHQLMPEMRLADSESFYVHEDEQREI